MRLYNNYFSLQLQEVSDVLLTDWVVELLKITYLLTYTKKTDTYLHVKRNCWLFFYRKCSIYLLRVHRGQILMLNCY